MRFFDRIFNRPEKNALILQQQLLHTEQLHVATLLERIKVLEDALLKRQSNPVENNDLKPEPTGKELEVLRLFETKQRITSHDVFEALHYKCKQSASERVSSMAKKGILKRIGNGKASKYILPA